MDARDAASYEYGGNTDCEAHEAVAVHIRMPCVIRMVKKDGSIFELLLYVIQ